MRRRTRSIRGPSPTRRFAAGAAVLALYLSRGAPLPEPRGVKSLHAFPDPDALASDLVEPDDYLPADYRVLASLLESEPEVP